LSDTASVADAHPVDFSCVDVLLVLPLLVLYCSLDVRHDVWQVKAPLCHSGRHSWRTWRSAKPAAAAITTTPHIGPGSCRI